MLPMIRKLVARLADVPLAFDALRWILEAGYRGHRRVLQRELPSGGGLVLDCGCGTGIFAGCFRSEEYTGIDLRPEYAAAASRRCREHRFHVMDARRLGFADHCFDRAFVSGVLHHLDDDSAQAVLQELARVLRTGGTLVIWEDVPTRSRANPIGMLIHRLDLGGHIRDCEGYRRLIEEVFPVARSYAMRSGFMDYHVFCCQT
jgi:ubiquinone/menaquinone biosynthesis C-methylase UbiE